MKQLAIYFSVIFSVALKAQPCQFTLNPAVSPYSITCSNTFVIASASPGSLNYTWTSIASPPVTGSMATFTNPGTYTVTASDGTNCVPSSQTFAVVMFTTTPVTTVTPNSQATNCSTNSAVTFTGSCTSPTVNLLQEWFSPLQPPPSGPPISSSNNTTTILSGNVPPGVYTLVTTNLVNGCKTSKTVTVTSLSAYPTFSVGSPTNFSIGCVPLNQTTISIINPVSTQTPPSTCSYTFLPPTFTGAVTPSIVLGFSSSTITTIPGTWTIIVQDNSNFCRTQLSVPIIQNTVAPDVSASMSTQTLICRTPTILATGTSTTNGTTVSWLLPVSPPNYSQPTVVIGTPANGPLTSTTSLNYASYTVVATNTVNACQNTSVVVINQNFKPPVSQPTISIATATAIYCTASVNPVVLTTGSSTTTSGGGPTAFVANPCWSGPSPQTPTCSPSTYSAYVAGVYTLVVEDNYNGCTAPGTVNVLDRTQPPVISLPVNTSTLDCGSSKATLSVALTGSNTGGMFYYVAQYPVGAAFTPTNIIATNLNPILNGTTSASFSVSLTGLYIYRVTNTLTGCAATGTYNVVPGDLQALFEANPSFGYAPLDVTFFNNSASSGGTGSITSIWNFGNGATSTSTLNNAASTTYTSAGIYTVTLFAQKGACIDSAMTTIKVELPSKLEVPNVFTPNGDGANDIFFFKATNLSELNVAIYDRWGNKVYEVDSKSGNIAWDGKNLQDKECPSGVYFYTIVGTGKDNTDYKLKGQVTLFR